MSDTNRHSGKDGNAVPEVWSNLPDMLPVTREEMDLIETHLRDIVAEMLNDLD